MVDKKLKDAGYIFVNSDDCWLLSARDANGDIQPDPAKFPASTGGINGTIAFIHSLGMKAGLYTARGHNTCAGYAGACGHEAQDARWYAAHLIDYLKASGGVLMTLHARTVIPERRLTDGECRVKTCARACDAPRCRAYARRLVRAFAGRRLRGLHGVPR